MPVLTLKLQYFTLKFLIHLEIICMQSDRYGSNFNLLHVDIKFFHKLQWRYLSPVCSLCSFQQYNSFIQALHWHLKIRSEDSQKKRGYVLFDNPTKINLEIQCNPNQNPHDILHRTRNQNIRKSLWNHKGM